MWQYEQATGRLLDDMNEVVGIGYSGFANGKNQPEFEHVAEVGPLPQGRYTIGSPHDSATHGPYVLPLIPDSATELFGRSAFLIHGDNKTHPGTASHGCIIMARDVRERIWKSGDHQLDVVSGLDPIKTETT